MRKTLISQTKEHGAQNFNCTRFRDLSLQIHPSLRQEHEAPPDQGHPDDPPADLRLRRVQDIITGGEWKVFNGFRVLTLKDLMSMRPNYNRLHIHRFLPFPLLYFT